MFNKFVRGCTLAIFGASMTAALAYDYNGTPTGALIHVHTTAQIKAQIAAGWRPTSISLEGIVPGVYRVCYVQNTGSHAMPVRFEGEQTLAQINAIRSAGWRLEDIEVTGARYAGIFIRNTFRPADTLWFAGATSGNIQTWLNGNPGWRLLDLDRYPVSGGERYSGVYIRNAGNGAVPAWGWFPNHSLSVINAWAQANNMRVIDLDWGSNGFYSAVLRRRLPGERIYWLAPVHSSRVLETLDGMGLRAVTMTSRATNNGTYYTMTCVNNVSPQAARLADLPWGKHNGYQGFYVREVSETNPIVSLNGTRAMHPSSSIKALIHYVGAWRTPAGELNTRLVAGLPMVTLHRAMMYNSDNPSSNTLMDAYSILVLETVAHSLLGMSQTTQIRNRFGTGGPYGNPNNYTETTLADFSRLYAAIQNSALGATKTAWMRSNMLNETRAFPWSTVIGQVRSEIGISTARYNDWRGRLRSVLKAGNNADSNDVNGYWSIAGVLTLPFKGSTTVVNKHFTFGHFVNRSTVSYTGTQANAIVGEMLREQIRQSMLTFR